MAYSKILMKQKTRGKNDVRLYIHTEKAKGDLQKTDFTIQMFFLHSCEHFIF